MSQENVEIVRRGYEAFAAGEAGSEVPAPLKPLGRLWPSQLVDRQALPPGRPEGVQRSERHAPTGPGIPAALDQLLDGAIQIGNPVNEDRRLAREVPGEKEGGAAMAQLDHGYPGPEASAATSSLGM